MAGDRERDDNPQRMLEKAINSLTKRQNEADQTLLEYRPEESREVEAYHHSFPVASIARRQAYKERQHPPLYNMAIMEGHAGPVMHLYGGNPEKGAIIREALGDELSTVTDERPYMVTVAASKTMEETRERYKEVVDKLADAGLIRESERTKLGGLVQAAMDEFVERDAARQALREQMKPPKTPGS